MHPYQFFIVNAIRGTNPDSYFDEFKRDILNAASTLQSRYPIKAQTLYRGVIVHPSCIKRNTLPPVGHIRFVSFSDSIEIAKTFADLEHPISALFNYDQSYRGAKGYLIEHEVNPVDILFHYSWTKAIGLDQLLPVETILEQREVMLKGGSTYPVKAFQAGTSDKSLNRTIEKHEPDWLKSFKNQFFSMR